MTSKPRVRAPELVHETTPKLAQLTEDVLFGDVWSREELSSRDRSLVTVAALVAQGREGQLPGHLRRALENGVSRAELAEVMTHLAFYSGWPTAMTGTQVLARVLAEQVEHADR